MEQGSLFGGARRLATSSAALLGVLSMAAVIMLAMYGRIEGQSALDFAKWIVIAYFTKVAVEDGAEKIGGKKSEAEALPAPLTEPPASDKPETDEPAAEKGKS